MRRNLIVSVFFCPSSAPALADEAAKPATAFRQARLRQGRRRSSRDREREDASTRSGS